MKRETEYDKQAQEFAEKHGVTMQVMYQSHYPRLKGSWVTGNYRVTLRRNGKEYSFEFSTSVIDSWGYRDYRRGIAFKLTPGLPPRVDTQKFFDAYQKDPAGTLRGRGIEQRKTPPALYDVLAALTKYDPGRFNEFCSEYGYSDDSISAEKIWRDVTDSISAEKIWRDVTDEWRNVERLFGDVLDELQEIQ